MSSIKCEECQVGRLRPVALTYMRKLGSHMVVLPDAPADKCDMCGRVNFDPGFLLTMQTMLEKLTRDPQESSRKKAPVTELPQEWTPVRRGG